jgi:protein-S-isoprenylcysteine O-methyltransferase Ste14
MPIATSKPSHSRAYDVSMRLPIVVWSTSLAMCSCVALQGYMNTVSSSLPGPIYAANIFMRLSAIGYLIIITGSVLSRTPRKTKLGGVEPRICAVIGTFLITLLVLFPQRNMSLTVGIISTLLMLSGNILAVLVLLQLRRSFSIMPEARELVTSGVYSFIRHPLYFAEEVTAIGAALHCLSSWTIAVLVIHLAFQLRRIRNEETLLAEVFPQYEMYKKKTSCIVPCIY